MSRFTPAGRPRGAATPAKQTSGHGCSPLRGPPRGAAPSRAPPGRARPAVPRGGLRYGRGLRQGGPRGCGLGVGGQVGATPLASRDQAAPLVSAYGKQTIRHMGAGGRPHKIGRRGRGPTAAFPRGRGGGRGALGRCSQQPAPRKHRVASVMGIPRERGSPPRRAARGRGAKPWPAPRAARNWYASASIWRAGPGCWGPSVAKAAALPLGPGLGAARVSGPWFGASQTVRVCHGTKPVIVRGADCVRRQGRSCWPRRPRLTGGAGAPGGGAAAARVGGCWRVHKPGRAGGARRAQSLCSAQTTARGGGARAVVRRGASFLVQWIACRAERGEAPRRARLRAFRGPPSGAPGGACGRMGRGSGLVVPERGRRDRSFKSSWQGPQARGAGGAGRAWCLGPSCGVGWQAEGAVGGWRKRGRRRGRRSGERSRCKSVEQQGRAGPGGCAAAARHESDAGAAARPREGSWGLGFDQTDKRPLLAAACAAAPQARD